MTNSTALQSVLHTVFIDDKTVKTNSRFIAEVFGKRHGDILRAVDNLDCSEDFSQRNFALANYLDAQGKQRPMVEMTFDGFTFLVMGFTGQAAAQFKEAYIAEFNRMRTQLINERDQEIKRLQQAVDDLEKVAKLPILPLNEPRRKQVLDLLAECMPIVDIARICRVSRETVRRIRDGKITQADTGDLFAEVNHG